MVGMRGPVGSVLMGAVALGLAGCGSDGTTTGGSTSSSSGGTTTTVPGAPTIGTATPGNASASIGFAAPSSNGGAAITGYTATCTGGGSVTGTGTASPITVAGLTNGTAYSCTVTATNSAGTGPASAAVSVTPSGGGTGGTSTASVLCPYSQSTPNILLSTGVTTTSASAWTCSATLRAMVSNGVPNHQIGTFPNAGNPNVPTTQPNTTFSATLAPVLGTVNNPSRALGYALNGVKFDPGTGGSCPSTATRASDCTALGPGTFSLEALQSFFDFGVDSNNAHVQPGGVYHYHGMPEGVLAAAGVTSSAQRMVLIGWAPDGFPIYARYGYTVATNATSALKVIRGSYAVDTVADAGRPSAANIALGVFVSDWNYAAGSGDLDDCNGRFGVTPEFPGGIYHYYATDTYPYLPRCFKGVF
jgi:YHYH protein/Fibronectin type III domain